MNKARKKKLHQIYAQIPKVNCKGKCTDYCGAIGMEKGEYEEMKKAAGKEPGVLPDLTCNLLKDGRCSIYEDRPLICRLWGTFPASTCPHGCQPERWLTPNDFIKLMGKVKELAGDGRVYKNCQDSDWQEDLDKKRGTKEKFRDAYSYLLCK